jgi:hypothetical protein
MSHKRVNVYLSVWTKKCRRKNQNFGRASQKWRVEAMKIRGLICSLFGHKTKTTKAWIDDSGFVKATEECARCGDTYNWETFHLTPVETKRFTSLEEFEQIKNG